MVNGFDLSLDISKYFLAFASAVHAFLEDYRQIKDCVQRRTVSTKKKKRLVRYFSVETEYS